MERRFDYSKIIVDPSKLVKGRRYYTADTVPSLIMYFKQGKTNIFDVESISSENENMRLPFAESGLWYSLWYPVEEKYKPYAKPDLAWLGKNVKAKADGETTMISKIAYSTRGEFVDLSNGLMYTLGMMFDHFTWEDGTPFGEVEDDKR